MNKKADTAFESIEWVWKIILTTLIIVFIFIIYIDHVSIKVDTLYHQHKILEAELLQSESCFAYKGLHGTEPMMIIPEKITDSMIANCATKNNIYYKVSLKNFNNQLIKSAKNMPLNIEMQLPLCKSTKDYVCSNFRQLVLYNSTKGFIPGIIDLEVISLVE